MMKNVMKLRKQLAAGIKSDGEGEKEGDGKTAVAKKKD